MDKLQKVANVELLLLIQRSDEKTLNNLYHQHREKFIQRTVGYYCEKRTEAGDVFQQAFTIFYLNIKNEKITELVFAIEIYLFSIGKSIFNKRRKDYLEMEKDAKVHFELSIFDFDIIEKEKRQLLKTRLHRLLYTFEEPCKTVLKLYYFCRFPMKTIVNEIGYNDEIMAKQKKYECLKKLKETITNQPHLEAALLGITI